MGTARKSGRAIRNGTRRLTSSISTGGVLVVALLLAVSAFAAQSVASTRVLSAIGEVPVAMPDGQMQQLGKLTASGRAASDRYGFSVAISGDTAVVGATGTELAKGSAYVYTRDAFGRWSVAARLTAADGQTNDTFGSAVAISGDTAFVGATNDDGGSGSVYVFTRDGMGAWSEQSKHKASDSKTSAYFGNAIALQGDTAVIGAYGDTTNRGAVYVLTRDGAGVWSEAARLSASDGAAAARFGCSVTLVGNDALVGASDDSSGKGAVYQFTRDGAGEWSQRAKFTASNAADAYFGHSVSGSDDTALLGSRGAAYVFTRDAAGVWNEKSRLTASDGATSVLFGFSVALSGDTAAIGAFGNSSYRGAVFIFGLDPDGGWSERSKLAAADAAASDNLGKSLAFSDGTALTGAPGDDLNAGAAYFFDAGYRIAEDTPLVVGSARGLLANDTDPITPMSSVTPSLVDTSALHGMLDLGADGSFTYTPERDWSGTATATYRDLGNGGYSGATTITILVESVKDAPVAVADAATCAEDAAATLDVLANDTDVDSSHAALSAIDFSAPSTGTIVAAASGEVTYTPPANWNGNATFTYRITDGELLSAYATATITVTPVNDAPVAVDDAIGCPENERVIIDLVANDVDIDNPRASLVATGFSVVSTGSVAASAGGGVVYAAPLDFRGDVTFTYRTFDGALLSAPATVTVSVLETVVTRIDGADRFVVADRTARRGWDPNLDKTWPGVHHIIVANGTNGKEADPLCSAGLAGVYDGPVLLTTASGISPGTAAVIAEIAAANPGVQVHIVGGTASVTDACWNKIRLIPGVSQTKDRIGGANRYEVSAGIASRMVAVAGGAAIPGVLLVAADNSVAFYDGLAASPIAYAQKMPMLAVRTGSIPYPVAQVLKGALAGKPRFAVSSARYTGAVPAAGSTRLATSSDRYTAASQIAQQALRRRWLSPAEAGIASKLPDALTGGAFLGQRGGALLYTDGSVTMPKPTAAYFASHEGEMLIGWVLGGHGSVTENQESTFWKLLK